ncbi:MAG: diphosphate--fructose-6-phosphate 1-phosphotransferase, partial [Pseudomonadota bacterium]
VEAQLADMANVEKMMPRSFITENGFGITDECRRYLAPLIEGEAYPPYERGLPQYIRLPLTIVDQKLGAFEP